MKRTNQSTESRSPQKEIEYVFKKMKHSVNLSLPSRPETSHTHTHTYTHPPPNIFLLSLLQLRRIAMSALMHPGTECKQHGTTLGTAIIKYFKRQNRVK